MPPKTETLRLILGDQLNAHHSWYRMVDDQVQYVLMEVRSEQEYVLHHVQKIQLFFAAMRAFANWLQQQGHRVRYYRIVDADNQHSFGANLTQLVAETGASRVEYQLPDEYRLDQELAQLAERLRAQGLEVSVCDTEHFLTERTTLAQHFKGKKQWLMESFYRMMRKKTGLLMDAAGEPVGGAWNYDSENRQPPPPAGYVFPKYPDVAPVPEDVLADIAAAGIPHFGDWHGDLRLPYTRTQALALLAHFVEHQLAGFGALQDAMVARETLLHHSALSVALNLKLLSPMEVLEAVVAAWQQAPQRYPLASVEGFVRQILGWREYVRGIYWALMPEYALRNHLGAHRPLPAWFWTGQTHMRCLSVTIGQSLRNAYAHHIQRLMVVGNFAALAGLEPAEVNAWYLGIYADALEWVQLPNTHGMSQYADGGVIATKPYVSGGAYLHRMSDYCKGCAYDPRKKHGKGACPFNSLYWHFLARNREVFARNPRMAMMYGTLDRMAPADRDALLQQAEVYLGQLEVL